MRRTHAPVTPKSRPIRIVVGLVACLASTAGMAQQRQLGAHEHGTAVLNVAVADATLSIEYKTPAANLVGFEHEAHTDAQKKAIHEAEKTLRRGEFLALPGDAACDLAASEVEYETEHHEAEGEHHDAHEHHDEKEEHHEEHHDEGHAEFHVLLDYECRNVGALTHIDLKLFERFPGNDKILIQVITPNGQGGGELTADNARLLMPSP